MTAHAAASATEPQEKFSSNQLHIAIAIEIDDRRLPLLMEASRLTARGFILPLTVAESQGQRYEVLQ